MATYLDRILSAHRQAAAADHRELGPLRAAARSAPPVRGFREALVATTSRGELAVIAEIKRRTPSKGELVPGLDPAGVAASYAAGGAACLSILTDEAFFDGSASDLRAARDAAPVPVLRKDFTVCEADVLDARVMGADAVLLIAAALDDDELRTFVEVAGTVALDAVVEVHDEAELERALRAGATVVGVNQRDLVTFEVDHERAERMGRLIPSGVVSIAESGVRGPADAGRLAAAGYDAVLVGESVVTATDRTAAVAALRLTHARTSS